MAAQGAYFELLYVNAVDEYLTLLYVVVAADERENRRFTGACRADKSNGLFSSDLERHILQHPFARIVRKPYMTEFNVPVNVFDLNRVRLVYHIRLYREYREYLFGGCKRGL